VNALTAAFDAFYANGLAPAIGEVGSDWIPSDLEKRLSRAQHEGDLPDDVRPSDLARYVCTVAQGLAVQAVGGASAAQRRRVVELVMRGWPE